MVDENWIPNRQAPHQWISTGALNRIVQLCPRRVADLEYFKSVGLREKSKKRFGNKLVQLINRFLRANRITLEGNFPKFEISNSPEKNYIDSSQNGGADWYSNTAPDDVIDMT